MPAKPPQSLETIPCDADFSIRRDGTWLYEGTPIRRPALVKLFSTILSRDAAGDYWLKTPVEKCRIQVEDCPFIAAVLEVKNAETAKQRLHFRTNIEQEVTLCDAFPLLLDEVGPYLALEKGLSARLSRPVYYELANWALRHGKEEAGKLWILSDGSWFNLGKLEE